MPVLSYSRGGGREIWCQADVFHVDDEGVVTTVRDGEVQQLAYFDNQQALFGSRRFQGDDAAQAALATPRFESLGDEEGLLILLGSKEVDLRRGKTVAFNWHSGFLWLETEQGESVVVSEDGLWRDGEGRRQQRLEIRGLTKALPVKPGRLRRPSALARPSSCA